jgi:thymidylate kinase
VSTGAVSSHIVELAGVPGAGKSTVAERLERRLRATGRPVDVATRSTDPNISLPTRLMRKAGIVGRCAVADPLLTAVLARSLVASGARRPIDLAARAVQWHVAQQQLRVGAARPGLTLLDEGIVQCLWSIGLRADIDPVLAALRRRPTWHTPDILVVLRVPGEVAAGRLGQRTSRHSRTQHLDPDAAAAELARGVALLDRVVNWWPAVVGPACQVIVVDGAGAIEDVADSVAAHVERAVTVREAAQARQ